MSPRSSSALAVTMLLVAQAGGCVGGTIGGAPSSAPAPAPHASGGSGPADPGNMPSAAVQVTLEAATGEQGQTVTVPIDLRNGGAAAITAITFDLQFDAANLTFNPSLTIAGAAAQTAGKSVTATSPAPGMARLIIFGVNATPMADGTLATLSFSIAPGAALGPTDLVETKIAASDAAAARISVSAPTGAINITP